MELEDLCKVKAGIFQNSAGGMNYYMSFCPKNPIGNVVVCHGFCEFAEKYTEVALEFVKKGYAVYVPEHRGHGYSQRECEDWEKVYIHSYEDYVEDFYCFIQRKIPLKKRRMILFAHSMGGAIGTLFLERYPTVFDVAILSAPMFGMKTGNCPEPIARIVAGIACFFGKGKEYALGQHGFDGIENFEHSSCTSLESYQRVFQLRRECIAYQTYGGTYRWVGAGLSATKQLLKRKNMQKIEIPILLLQAENDHMVKNEAHMKFVTGTKQTSILQIRGSKHEIFHSLPEQREEYYKNLFGFLEDRLWEDASEEIECCT